MAKQIINGKNGLVCDFCGATKDEVSFFIGATNEPDWCMIEGTGKISCPACYPKASQEGQDAIDRYIERWNSGAKHAN